MSIRNNYYPELNSLRGIAAISVVLWHYYQVIDNDFTKIFKPYLFFMYGEGAVILFFVLSGFVLSSSYASNKCFLDYLIRRIFRIYPAYYAACLVSILGYLFLHPLNVPWLSSGFNIYSTGVFNFSNLLNVALLVNPKYFNTFVTPSWSLTIEMTISIIFPLLLMMFRKYKNFGGLIYILLIYIINRVNSQYLLLPSTYYSIYFVLGILLYKNHNKLSATPRLKYLSSILFLPLYVVMYASVFFSTHFSQIIKDVHLLTGLGASGIILVILHNGKLKSILNCRLLTFFGKISYSLYLLHMPILLILIYTFLHYINLQNILLIYIYCFTITIFISMLSYTYVELPFIKIGRRVYERSISENLISK